MLFLMGRMIKRKRVVLVLALSFLSPISSPSPKRNPVYKDKVLWPQGTLIWADPASSYFCPEYFHRAGTSTSSTLFSERAV